MELYRKVRLACRDGMSERAAARHFGVSRESVRKMLAFSVPPGYRRTAPVRRPKLDGFTGLIDEWLRGDRKDDHRKQRHTAKRIDRERRLVERRIKAAKFPTVKSLDSFEFKAIPSLNKAQVLELARCEWIERRENVIALGPSGTGKELWSKVVYG